MLYNKPFDQTSPAAGYVNGNPATNTPGSIPCAEGLEYPQREIVNAITAAGLTPTNGDLTQLAQAIVALASSRSTTQSLAQAQPIFPEITAAGNVFGFTSAAGSVVLPTNQSWQHRGLVSYSTALFAAGALTFATQASKTYHLVWDAPGTGLAAPAANFPTGLFTLIDRTGASPVETDPSYDTTYDRMLCARVVTDGSNIPTVTPLVNRQILSGEYYENPTGAITSIASGGVTQPAYYGSPRIIFDTRTAANGGDGCGRCQSYFATNWARTPRIAAAQGYVGYTGISGQRVDAGTWQEGGSSVTLKTVTRYGTLMNYQSDYNLGGIVDSGQNFILTGCFARAFLDILA